MYDVKKIEEEWKIYNRKKYRKIYFMLPVFFSLVAFGYFYEDVVQILEKKIVKINVLPSKKVNKKSFFIANTSLRKLETRQPSREKIINIQEEKRLTLPSASIEVKTIQVPSVLVEIEKKPQKINLKLIDNVSPDAYEDVENRFHETHDINDAIFLARVYYKYKNYEKSEKWALLASSVDPDIEEPWLIYAKTKAKQGEKNKAIEILRQYENGYSAIEVSKILHEIEAGTL